MKFVPGVFFSIACLMSLVMWLMQPTGDSLVRQGYSVLLLMLVAVWLSVNDDRKAG